jgi:biopolymer transport protein ExbB
MRFIKLKTLLLVAFFSSVVFAEDAAKHDLEKAFYKEYSFLLKEKRAMQSRINQLKSKHSKEQSLAKRELQNLKTESDALLLEIDRNNDQLTIVEREILSKESGQSVFDATLEQASISLVASTDAKLQGITDTVEMAMVRLDKNSRIHNEPEGVFFLQDGTEVSGEIIHYGAVARFGISTDAQGPLAPAGGGAFKLWESVDKATIQAVANNQTPVELPLFLYDSESKEVSFVEEKDVLTIINSGGPIAWVIIILGALATLLAVLRFIFLFTLGNANKSSIDAVASKVAEGDIESAKQQASKIGGSIKRVFRSTLNNIHRDREHVEDTIAEAVLHEHSHLDRFHAMIMVIAAISPLLGLLGTVTGMIETFDVITEFGTGDPKLLSGGISTALVTTELGLIVAIPVLVIGTILASWSSRIKDDIEKSALHLVNQYQNKQA